MTGQPENKPAAVLVLPPDGRFHSPDIWSVMHRQAGGFDLVIIDRSRGAAKLMPMMAKAAVRTVKDDAAPLGAQINQLARELGNSYMVFFTDRVLPTHDHWLRRLTAPLDEGAAASFGRNITAAGGNYFIIEDLRKRYPPKGDSASLTIDNCAIRRSVLIEKPFPEEPVNDPAAVWMMRNDIIPAYAPEALVMQDTYFTLKEVYVQARAAGADLAAAGKTNNAVAEIAAALGEIASDVGFCFGKRKPQYLWYPFMYRSAIHAGRLAGQRRGMR